MEDVLAVFADIVTLKGDKLRLTNVLEHKMCLEDTTKPVFVPSYRIPFKIREQVEQEVDKWEEEGIVRPSSSLFNFPKKDGSVRACVDFNYGRESVNKMLECLVDVMGIRKVTIIPYGPEANGLCGRANREVIETLRITVGTHDVNWDRYIPQVQHSINAMETRTRAQQSASRGRIDPSNEELGGSGKCENYRGITLICHAVKLYERILEKRARRIIEPQTGEEQHGYRKDRSTSDLIFTLRLVVEKSWEYNRSLYLAFIGLEKAFGSVPRNKLWRCLGEVYGLDGDIMLSADDIAFWTYDQEELEGAFVCLNDCLTEAGLRMNIGKTETLTASKQPQAPTNIMIRNAVKKDTDSFKYLGCVFSDKGDKNREEITERIKKCNRCSGGLYPVMRDAYVPREVKKAICEGLLTRIMTYGSESWTVTSKDRSRVQASEMKSQRTKINKTRRDKMRNENVRTAGAAPVMNKIEKGQLRWLGHIMRMDESRITKKRWNWIHEGRRLRGRPRKRWKGGVEEILTKHSVPTIEELRRNGTFEDRRD
ncbi:uncharacterized protein [Macrobrachium rosenbergii]|uniref:uncharacterized protein n=1 Tax=Macrobrachium rosenbergii TaxID=79674 RepID=UPI0034D58DFF